MASISVEVYLRSGSAGNTSLPDESTVQLDNFLPDEIIRVVIPYVSLRGTS